MDANPDLTVTGLMREMARFPNLPQEYRDRVIDLDTRKNQREDVKDLAKDILRAGLEQIILDNPDPSNTGCKFMSFSSIPERTKERFSTAGMAQGRRETTESRVSMVPIAPPKPTTKLRLIPLKSTIKEELDESGQSLASARSNGFDKAAEEIKANVTSTNKRELSPQRPASDVSNSPSKSVVVPEEEGKPAPIKGSQPNEEDKLKIFQHEYFQ